MAVRPLRTGLLEASVMVSSKYIGKWLISRLHNVIRTKDPRKERKPGSSPLYPEASLLASNDTGLVVYGLVRWGSPHSSDGTLRGSPEATDPTNHIRPCLTGRHGGACSINVKRLSSPIDRCDG